MYEEKENIFTAFFRRVQDVEEKLSGTYILSSGSVHTLSHIGLFTSSSLSRVKEVSLKIPSVSTTCYGSLKKHPLKWFFYFFLFLIINFLYFFACKVCNLNFTNNKNRLVQKSIT